MSLFRQIQLVIAMLLLAALAIVMKIDFDKSRAFSSQQLFNNGKNVANLLALSLSSHPSDTAYMETSINAMFDGGHFEEIRLDDTAGKVLYKRSQALVMEGVPPLFVDFVDLSPPMAEAKVISGWNITGTLYVKPHAGPTYLQLWDSFKNLFILFMILGAMTIIVSHVILRYLLESLMAIQNQAEAISDNRFIINDSVPRTPELKKVVLAMNAMVEKVRLIYSRQLEHLKNYQELNFKDLTTGLYNRKYLVKQLSNFLESDNENAKGQVFMVSLAGMESLTLSINHPALTSFFKGLADILSTETQALKDVITARLPGNEFAVVLPNCDRDKGVMTAKTLMGNILGLLSGNMDLLENIRVYGGFASYGHGDHLKDILSKTDYALSVAKSGPSGSMKEYIEEDSQPVLGKFQWKTLIEESLVEGRFVLSSQPVLSETGELHREIYVNMVDPQGIVRRASYFMPMVITLGLANKVDRYVMESVAAYLEENRENVLAVNLTTEFCTDRMSFMWLRKFLATSRHLRDFLVFEMHECTLTQHPDICLDIAGLLKGMGYRFGIDRFTMNDEALDLLSDLGPQYIKVEHSYLHDTAEKENAQTALNALMTLTDSLGITLVAVMVETEEQKRILSEKHITCFQGTGVADIAPVRFTHDV